MISTVPTVPILCRAFSIFVYLYFYDLATPAAAGNSTVLESSNGELKNNVEEPDIVFSIGTFLLLVEGSSQVVTWISTVEGVKKVEVTVKEEYTAVIANHEEFLDSSLDAFTENLPVNLTSENKITLHGFFNVSATYVGFSYVKITLKAENNEILAFTSLDVAVRLKNRIFLKTYSIVAMCMLVIIHTIVGTTLDLELVKSIIKTPIGPCIGLFCQFGCLPVISYTLGIILLPDQPLLRLGLFASGCSPGGGYSNIWCHLLGGCLNLSVIMTFASTVTALGFVPLWLTTVGNQILKDVNLVIPYASSGKSIAMVVFSCLFGIILQLKIAKAKQIAQRVLTPFSLINITCSMSFGMYCNSYLFYFLTWQIALACLGQSFVGALVGALIAFICRRPKKEIISIGVEVAAQNNSFAYILLMISLDSPASDIAILMPATVSLFIFLIMSCPLIVKELYRIICGETDRKTDCKFEDVDYHEALTKIELETLTESPLQANKEVNY